MPPWLGEIRDQFSPSRLNAMTDTKQDRDGSQMPSYARWPLDASKPERKEETAQLRVKTYQRRMLRYMLSTRKGANRTGLLNWRNSKGSLQSASYVFAVMRPKNG